ncbi:MAG: PEP-CTERM sorting domain-containing protein [Rhodopirellula sp. JB055]|uniref:PEP-CTERM sorting domain-containing protein n=1 Tax=Rhodopirellula sp. JB055 TaxID=3342846 RepID=UPI00370B0D74
MRSLTLTTLFALLILMKPDLAYGDVVTGGTLTFDLDGDAFADGADVDYINTRGQATNGSFLYDTNQSFIEFAGHSATSNPGRPAASGTFADAVTSGWTRPSTTGLNYGFNSDSSLQTLTFDAGSVATGGATGSTQFTGGDSFWFANSTMYDPIADVPTSTWFHYKNLTLSYDADRMALDSENSGWLFTHNLPGSLALYDIRNLTIDTTAATLSTPGTLTFNGDLFTTPEFRGQVGIQSGLDVGSFSFAGVTAVPEPSSVMVLAAAGAAGAFWRRRKRKLDAPVAVGA